MKLSGHYSRMVNESIFRPVSKEEMDRRHGRFDSVMPWDVAVTRGNMRRMGELIAQGQDVNEVIELHSGATALTWYAYTGNSLMLEFLLTQKGINVNHEEDSGFDAIYFAVREGHSIAASMLLKHPKINLSTIYAQDENRSILQRAQFSVKKDMEIIVGMLLKQPGIPINNIDNTDNTALTMALLDSDYNTIEKILEYPGIDVNLVIGGNQTAYDGMRYTVLNFVRKDYLMRKHGAKTYAELQAR
jgi:ankyrin repeat protein